MSLSKFYIAEEAGGIPKWKIALAIGGTFLLGAGIYYKLWGKSEKRLLNSDKKSNSNIFEAPNEETATKKEHTVVDESPLGRANQKKTEGNKFFKLGQYEEAVRCYSEAVEACPPNQSQAMSIFFQNRAACHEHLNDWQNVMKDCTSSLQQNPQYMKALMRRARAAESLNDFSLALEDYTAVCVLESFNNPDSLGLVDKILKKMGQVDAEKLFSEKRKSLISLNSIRSYFSAFCCDPVCNYALNEEIESEESKEESKGGFKEAREHMRNMNYLPIIDCCTSELEDSSSPHAASALLLRGAMHVQYNDVENALKDLSAAADKEDAALDVRVAALAKLGALKMSLNKTDESIAIFEKALKLDENNADVYHQRGQMYLLLNNVTDAIEDFNKAVELKPNFAIGYVQKLHTDYRYALFLGNKSEAEEVLKKFVDVRKKFPDCPEAHLLYGQILMDDDRYMEAEALFKEYEAIDASNPVLYVYQGMLLIQSKGELTKGTELMKKALDIDPLCEMALENLATLAVQTGNLQEGIDLFDKAIPLAKSMTEMSHYCSLRDAARAQVKVVKRLGITLPSPAHMMN